jgi:hypothetical protein
MSDIGLIMNATLGVLLVGALFLGWRLEGRLKALRASHQNFARAVEDLDRAAARAEQGLADLRAATDEAAETLAGRIERAGHLAQRLETLSHEAVGAEQRLAAAVARPAPAPRHEAARPEPIRADPARAAAPRQEPAEAYEPFRAGQSRDTAFARFAQRYGATRPAAPSAMAEAAARNDLILEDDEAPPPRNTAAETVARLDRLRALGRPPSASPASPTLLRGRADEELFEAPAPRRAAGGFR